MRWEDDRWRAFGPHASLDDANVAVAPLVRAVLELEWPTTLSAAEGELEIVPGASEQYDLHSEDGRHPLRVFAIPSDREVFYALDLHDPADAALALTVWQLEHDGSQAERWGTLAELLDG